MEHSPVIEINPSLFASKDGTVLYSNEAGEPLLFEWGAKVGEKLPSNIVDLMQKVISQNSPKKIEVNIGNKQYLVIFSPIPEQECVNISGFDISYSKVLEERFYENKTQEINLELSKIVDVQAIQSLLDDFYKFAHITIALVDLKGNILVSVGWQDICTKFHRVHPVTCKFCVESDTKLSAGVPIGEFKLYKCKNNMWDIATPIIVDGLHLGNIFSGQFFFEDEPLDYELFRSQARLYGFNEEEYMAALEKVPRLSREAVETSMSFFMRLANMISQLSFSNIKLAQSLLERDNLLEALQKSESKYRNIVETAQEGIWIIDSNCRTVFVNYKFSEMLGYSIDEIMGQTPQKFLSPEFRTVADDRLREHRQRVRQAIDYRFIRKDGSDLWCIVSTHQLFDDEGKYAGSLGMLTDITERKRAEEALKESEAKANALILYAPTGIYEIDYRKPKFLRVNDAMCALSGYTREEFLSMNPSDLLVEESKKIFFERIRRQLAGEKINDEVEFNVRKKDGSLINVILNISFLKDKPYTALVIGHDVTERKKAEEALKEAKETLEEKVKERTAELEESYKFLKEIEIVRKQEIHHRIKNNLQVISSLLDLQAEKFNGKQCIKDSEVLEAFKESQDRVISMALIHEELHKGRQIDTLNFSHYIEQLAENLFLTYQLGNEGISLVTDIEEDTYFDMDTAIPLGIIINELVSNSLKYAFHDRDNGKIMINLQREETVECKIEGNKSITYILSVSDNGVGIPEDLDIENLNSLGLQLITTLVDQLDGEFKLKRENGTEFIIRYTVTKKLKEEDLPAVEVSVTADKTTQLTLYRFCLPE